MRITYTHNICVYVIIKRKYVIHIILTMTSIDKILNLEQRQMFMYADDQELENLDIRFLKVTLARSGMTRKDIDNMSKQEIISCIKEKIDEYLQSII